MIRPTGREVTDKTDIQLTLSGHTHGFPVWLSSRREKMFPASIQISAMGRALSERQANTLCQHGPWSYWLSREDWHAS